MLVMGASKNIGRSPIKMENLGVNAKILNCRAGDEEKIG
jgi:hypothetical protein